MFAFFFLGLFILLYIFIRSHAHPPINWMGISETSNWWLKIGKFFNAVHRKQYGNMGQNVRTVLVVFTQLKYAFYNFQKEQFNIILLFVGYFGILYSFIKSKWLFLTFFTFFVSSTIGLVYGVNFKFGDRDLYFVKVFFYISYFSLSIFIALGIQRISDLIFFIYKSSNQKNKNETTSKSEETL